MYPTSDLSEVKCQMSNVSAAVAEVHSITVSSAAKQCTFPSNDLQNTEEVLCYNKRLDYTPADVAFIMMYGSDWITNNGKVIHLSEGD